VILYDWKKLPTRGLVVTSMAFVKIGYVRKNKWSINVLQLFKKKIRKKCLKREHKWWFTYGDFSF